MNEEIKISVNDNLFSKLTLPLSKSSANILLCYYNSFYPLQEKHLNCLNTIKQFLINSNYNVFG